MRRGLFRGEKEGEKKKKKEKKKEEEEGMVGWFTG